ncbi:GmrSD restriction endonuclease domain-containing protein [Clostridium perfringens]|uniref:GmrSD restriction endonuclease domain-containing protein n=1 Tax=Clostridium perfringens TaxID=1502 RepID=UPI001FAFA60C|nr:DUF262 domain-containing protein [Clostridium perfringens]MDT7914705.1 DUF262 domain-containing protein [Clostridium perfringens]MDT7927811.1 DUF262 domain-containing protein [Clostridium perfringens]MDT7960000.1 DUF262 domain-containing protein [Clostridium perfringens]MDT7976603.1 DUF262 domain-containing protein [Clostridium perfringens]MDT7979681.1 DUF262 domain-containing protein [Clostridium perfringens]
MQDLTVRSENIQRVFRYYIENRLLVNRRYQRKLVWSIEEKSAFIDSLIKGYPVPLILLAEINENNKSTFEIIDGMQRLNAIMSFIEGEFSVQGEYFDLNAMAESKLLYDNGELEQKEPILDREKCTNIASYVLPLSIYKMETTDQIDEIFRRINSNGKHLSKQEIRQAGATSSFASLVRIISSEVRGDSSLKDQLLLNDMKKISITNKELNYGINVDDVFWVKNTIIRREQVRESKDEEIIADIIAYMVLKDKPISSSKMLNELYGITGSKSKRHAEIEQEINKIGKEKIKEQFYSVLEVIKVVLSKSNKKFNELIFNKNTKDKIPRYFQVVFLALHELLVVENKKVASIDGLIDSLKGIASNINISQGGGTWAAGERENNVCSVYGIIKKNFVENKEDPAIYKWSMELENILNQSTTEQASFDFKIGFCNADRGEFLEKTFSKAIRTLTAMVNRGKGEVGYIVVGVADKEDDAKTMESITGESSIRFGNYFITGVNHDIKILNTNDDRYYQKITQAIEKEPIEEIYKSKILSKIKYLDYYGKRVIILKLDECDEAILYDDNYYERRGANNHKIEMKNVMSFLGKFSNS